MKNEPSKTMLYLFLENTQGSSLILPVQTREEADEMLKRSGDDFTRALLLDLGSEVKLVAKLR